MDMFFQKNKHVIMSLDMEDGSSSTVTGAELNNFVFDSGQPWCISANGTIFRTDVDGIIPGLLSSWYADRKQMKKVLWQMIQLRTGLIKTTSNVDIPAPPSLPNLKRLEYDDLTNFIELTKTGTDSEIASAATVYGLEIKDGAFYVREEFVNNWKEGEGYWDKRQLVRKINLNSLYGGLLNEHCRFFDQRLGQSTTLTGRSITRHMAAKSNEFLAGVYDETGDAVIYGDTDSVSEDAIIETSVGPMTIKDLFDQCETKTTDESKQKEYGFDQDIMVMSYDKDRDEPYLGHINYVYKHEVTKDMYEIEDSFGNVVTVTEDHSIMVERNNELIELKPFDLSENDVIISLCIKR
jgi:metal-responsive CopG/Arc/MetJ family transcriptional regulator